MTDLHSLTLVDLPVAAAYAESRFHASVEYDYMVWSLKCPSGTIYRGLTFAEACGWAEIGEPAFLPKCSNCDEPFTFEKPWIKDAGCYFHSLCLKSAQAEVDRLRMEHEAELWSGG